MAKYKLLKDISSSVQGFKLSKDEVLEGSPNPKLAGFINLIKDGKNISVSDKFEVVKVDDSTPVSVAAPSQVAASDSSDKTLTVMSSVGALAGLGFAYYRKSGVKGYIGYFILGSIVGSLIAHIVKPKGDAATSSTPSLGSTPSTPTATPSTQVQTASIPAGGNKDAKIVEFFKTLQSNPPKTEAEATSRAASFGLVKADITAYNEKQNKG